ncbi:tetratricopeptide repeat protein [Aureibaculum sp. A20]|uniref:Tetratricopeptide repeat protein n=1 Tax=Aureibaculum flavum TaxID=2795986 RepID=A0ABS0WMQ6_9FLAO|nr:tetratricopeptide repeat protein [Aureibaculum flavum]MBJ2173232.1 tetratricopeptide repeat protein [Aureibaculum flavum]
MDKEALLTNYFSDSLTAEERQLFNQLLENDTKFKEQFEFEKDLKRAIKEKERIQLKAKLQDFETKLKHKSTPKTSNYKAWAIAASIAILLSVGWFGYDNFIKLDYNELYSENFQQYPNTSYTITRGDTDDSTERQAFVAYETGNYKTAIENFEKLDSNAKEYIDFYKAQTYLELNKINSAKSLFKKVISDNVEFVAESHWYLALISIKEKDKQSAISYLEQLVTNYDFNKEKAEVLLDHLK